MADSTINGLTALSGANVDNTADQFAIWDNSDNTTKKITRTELLTGIPTGTAAAPAITPTGDSNTGVHFPAADTIGLATGGVQRVTIDSGGRVSLGTTNPTAYGGAGSFTVNTGQAAVNQGTANFYSNSLSGADSGGNIVLGGSSAVSPSLFSGAAFCEIRGRRENSTDGNTASYLALCTRGGTGNVTERFRIDSTGQVGIGKTPSLGLLDVNGDAYFNTVRVGLGNGGVATNTAVGKGCLAAVTSGGLNVAVGENAGDSITTGSSNTIIGQGTDPSANNGTGQIVIGKGVTGTANNRITVGITTNIAELDLDGADTSWAASSDERLKQDIATYTAGLDVITALRPVTFRWKAKRDVPTDLTNYYADSDEPVHGDASKTYHGFIAQEVKAVLDANPSVPNGQHLWEQRDDGVQTLAPADLVPILVNAIKQLHAEVQALKNK